MVDERVKEIEECKFQPWIDKLIGCIYPPLTDRVVSRLTKAMFFDNGMSGLTLLYGFPLKDILSFHKGYLS